MNKKAYVAPQTETVQVAPAQMIAASLGISAIKVSDVKGLSKDYDEDFDDEYFDDKSSDGLMYDLW